MSDSENEAARTLAERPRERERTPPPRQGFGVALLGVGPAAGTAAGSDAARPAASAAGTGPASALEKTDKSVLNLPGGGRYVFHRAKGRLLEDAKKAYHKQADRVADSAAGLTGETETAAELHLYKTKNKKPAWCNGPVAPRCKKEVMSAPLSRVTLSAAEKTALHLANAEGTVLAGANALEVLRAQHPWLRQLPLPDGVTEETLTADHLLKTLKEECESVLLHSKTVLNHHQRTLAQTTLNGSDYREELLEAHQRMVAEVENLTGLTDLATRFEPERAELLEFHRESSQALLVTRAQKTLKDREAQAAQREANRKAETAYTNTDFKSALNATVATAVAEALQKSGVKLPKKQHDKLVNKALPKDAPANADYAQVVAHRVLDHQLGQEEADRQLGPLSAGLPDNPGGKGRGKGKPTGGAGAGKGAEQALKGKAKGKGKGKKGKGKKGKGKAKGGGTKGPKKKGKGKGGKAKGKGKGKGGKAPGKGQGNGKGGW